VFVALAVYGVLVLAATALTLRESLPAEKRRASGIAATLRTYGGLLHDRTSYGVYGDHGGAQESVQRVPMVFWTPGMTANTTSESFRTPDVMPTILAAMGISQTSPTDGRAHSLGR